MGANLPYGYHVATKAFDKKLITFDGCANLKATAGLRTLAMQEPPLDKRPLRVPNLAL